MIKSRAIEVQFRGERNYLHGTDLFDSIHAAFLTELGADSLRDIHFKIPKFFETSVILEMAPRFESGLVVWTCQVGDKTWVGRLVENTIPPSPKRKPFDEMAFCQAMKMEGEHAICVGGQEPPIDTIVFLTKFLHTDRYPGERWVFTRLELAESLKSLKGKSLEIQTVLISGAAFTKNKILCDGKSLGEIYFSKLGGES